MCIMRAMHTIVDLYTLYHCIIVQYRIFLSSGLQWLGLCGSVVRRMGNKRVSVSTMAILKEPLLNTHFDDSFDVYNTRTIIIQWNFSNTF